MAIKKQVAQKFNMCLCICVQGPGHGWWGGRRGGLELALTTLGFGIRNVSRGYTSRGWCSLVWVETGDGPDAFKALQAMGLSVWWAGKG